MAEQKKPQHLLDRLNRIEAALTAKGHVFQDYSTVKLALVDIIGVLKEMVGAKDKKTPPA